MRPLRILWRSLGLLLKTLGGLWSVLMILLMAGSLALNVAMAVIPAVFSAVSGVVETATGTRSLRQRQAAREAALAGDLTRAENRADDLSRQLADSRAAERRLARELADGPVSYRGERRLAREAVKDTATRVSGRLRFAAARNITSMAGEALPVVGVGVIAAATAWEIHDTCALMGEMRELDAAFNPDDPVSDDEVCGMTPPSRAELWEMVRGSPSVAWEGAQQMYAGLPELSFAGTYGRVAGWFGGLYDWAFEDDPAPALPGNTLSDRKDG